VQNYDTFCSHYWRILGAKFLHFFMKFTTRIMWLNTSAHIRTSIYFESKIKIAILEGKENVYRNLSFGLGIRVRFDVFWVRSIKNRRTSKNVYYISLGLGIFQQIPMSVWIRLFYISRRKVFFLLKIRFLRNHAVLRLHKTMYR